MLTPPRARAPSSIIEGGFELISFYLLAEIQMREDVVKRVTELANEMWKEPKVLVSSLSALPPCPRY